MMAAWTLVMLLSVFMPWVLPVPMVSAAWLLGLEVLFVAAAVAVKDKVRSAGAPVAAGTAAVFPTWSGKWAGCQCKVSNVATNVCKVRK